MRTVFSGISTFASFVILLFWAGEEWLWRSEVLFQLALFIILGKIVFSCALFLSALFNSGRPLLMGGAFMSSVFLRWMLWLLFCFDIEAVLPIIGACHGLPYTLLCAALVYFLTLPFFKREHVSRC